MKVLIAEDHPPLQKTLQFLMDDWEYEADIVSNGREAVEMAFLRDYDLCLMDLHMPVMNGCQAAEVIRRRIRFIPTLALTANCHFDAKQHLDRGIDDYLEKPFDYSVLHEKIKTITIKRLKITKRENFVFITKEKPMNAEHLKELKELAKKGLVKLVLRGKGDEFVVHKNVQNKISHDFIAESKELTVFLDRSKDKPGLCHLYKANLYANMKYLLPEEFVKLTTEEDDDLEKYLTPADRCKEE